MQVTQSEGKKYWRSLEELSAGEDFQRLLLQKYPRGAAALEDALGANEGAPGDGRAGAVSRRRFLQLIGASMALAGLSGCTASRPRETIVPYVRQPEGLVPGVSSFYATAMVLGGYAFGILAESHEGRPTKIEGNPDHPASLGASDVFAQALVLELYDPDRSKTVLNAGAPSSWEQFTAAMGGLNIANLRILSGNITSPSLAAQIEGLLSSFPGSRLHRYEPVGNDNALEGTRLAFGSPAEAVYNLAGATVIVSLDSDFLHDGPGAVRYARDFADGRRITDPASEMNRLYVIESTATITGAMADHRWGARPSQVEGVARALAAALGVEGASGGAPEPVGATNLAAVAADLQAHRGRSVVMAGRSQSPAVHALAHAMNSLLGNAGATVSLIATMDTGIAGGQAATISDLVRDIDDGSVDTLVILGGNPVYDAPADLGFADAMVGVPVTIHLGLYPDETATRCTWHVPEAHSLESWGDARAYDGTVTIVQPLIAPFWGGRTKSELLATLQGAGGTNVIPSAYDALRAYWQDNGLADDQTWRKALHDGIIANSASTTETFTIQTGGDWLTSSRTAPSEGLEALFVPDPSVYDGRFANSGWLQELPKPITKLTWDNAALISATTADRLGLVSGDVVDLALNGRTVSGPVCITPGQPDDTVTLPLGYGRTAAGKVGNGVGFNAYLLRPSDAPWHAGGLQLTKSGAHVDLAATQSHFSIEGRDIIQAATLVEFRENPELIRERIDHPEGSIYPEWEYKGHAWGMSIDMNSCIGCNACVIGCVAENNIPVVGKEQVLRQREMHWLRIDTYFEGDATDLNPIFQPMACQHCENAPCEYVCPVAATAHSSEGLNDMVYNRCVGTRYCSNNCPYKVRRFNFLQFSDWNEESLKPQRNPDVTVRSRGVMEKCTYCVQRIEEARSDAERQGRPIRDGEIVTACQQACPTRAIVFGDINDPNSEVSRLKTQPQDYGVLTQLNTKPRTSYLARFRNPNEAIGAEGA